MWIVGAFLGTPLKETRIRMGWAGTTDLVMDIIFVSRASKIDERKATRGLRDHK